MYDVIIIGAGASGVMCAATLKYLNSNLKVLLLEKNDKLGKKLLITGNGKCNLGNVNCSLNNYYSNSNLETFKDMLLNNTEYISYLKQFGIVVKEDNKRLYPYSMQSISVCKSFERILKKLNVQIKYNYEVLTVIKNDNLFIINDSLKSEKLIISTGGKSYPKTGSTGFGYNVLKSFGHKICKLYPSLVNLKVANTYIKDLFGVRFDAKASLIVDDKIIKKEEGQVQFTRDSLSGICIFNLSIDIKKYLEEHKKVKVSLDLIPEYDDKILKEYFKKFDSYKIEDALSTILNNKLSFTISKIEGVLNKKVSDLSDEKFNLLINRIHNFCFDIVDTGDFTLAQVTSGGVLLEEFTTFLESKKCSNLYAIGEVLDITGICGGYNLAWAFNSALIVSKKVINMK